jgi:hypothetical protein
VIEISYHLSINESVMDDTESDTSPFLPHQENTKHEALWTSSEPHRWQRRSILHTLVYILAGWGVTSIFIRIGSSWSTSQQTPDLYDVYRPKTLPPGLNLCDCGATIKEALSRSCIYDALATAWLPPTCRDDELTAEFERAGPGPDGAWEYFLDENGTVPLSKPQIAALGETGGAFWAARDWHIAHCVFYWQKLVRMRDTGAIMEARFDTLEHAKHCGQLILKPVPDHLLLLEVPVMMNSSGDDTRVTRVSVLGEVEHDMHHG